jgi:hypothetical protein
LIQGEKGELTEARSRITKVVSAMLPMYLKGPRHCMLSAAADIPANGTSDSITCGGSEDLLTELLVLSPSNRRTLPEVMELLVFTDLPHDTLEVSLFFGLRERRI